MGREGRRGRRDLERSLVPGPGPGTGIQPRVQSGTRGRNPSPVRVPGPGPDPGPDRTGPENLYYAAAASAA